MIALMFIAFLFIGSMLSARFLNVDGWIVGIVAVAVFILVNIFMSSLDFPIPKPYRFRDCMGRDWKKQFPKISKHDIRLFLTCFIDGIGFSEKNRLKFNPDDKINDVCRSIYHGLAQDGDEIEDFMVDVSNNFKIGLDDLEKFYYECDADPTLGEIFDFVIKNGNLPATGQVHPV